MRLPRVCKVARNPAGDLMNAVTPMMAQYLEIKAAYPDALLFYRMGDFYEMFFDDAVAAAEALDIALTKRGKHDGADIPMCGVPVHSAEGYLLTLIRKGFRVAVCEQMESPAEAKKRGSKSVVKRDVVRLVTPGTLTEEALLESRQESLLAALAGSGRDFALAWLDLASGRFVVRLLHSAEEINAQIERRDRQIDAMLEPRFHGRVEIDVCPRCRGVWLLCLATVEVRLGGFGFDRAQDHWGVVRGVMPGTRGRRAPLDRFRHPVSFGGRCDGNRD